MANMETPLDHVGWDLWRAAQAWKRLFSEAMVARGYAWFGEGRGNLVHLIGPSGCKQSALVTRSQLSKQAVQQFLDELERDGIIRREPDPADARGKIIRFTELGHTALREADAAKRAIEADIATALGASALAHLKSDLDKIAKLGK
jgi:DNA-binding MarR family transcriptional regulator